MTGRPILLGMCDTRPPELRSGGPLWPTPGSSGWRLWQLIRAEKPWVTEEDFCATFERRNVIDAQQWDWREAWVRAPILRAEFSDRVVICLGTEVRKALGLSLPRGDLGPVLDSGGLYFVLPHPSGRCRWYNEPENGARVGRLLAEFF